MKALGANAGRIVAMGTGINPSIFRFREAPTMVSGLRRTSTVNCLYRWMENLPDS